MARSESGSKLWAGSICLSTLFLGIVMVSCGIIKRVLIISRRSRKRGLNLGAFSSLSTNSPMRSKWAHLITMATKIK